MDRTIRRNIIWATDTYQEFRKGFGRKDAIDAMRLVSRYPEIRDTRLGKRAELTKKHGEVFTPFWVCKKMCDHAHKVLRGKDWQKYVNATVLEITCGEAPFLASRRDLAIDSLVPLADRVGLLSSVGIAFLDN